MVHRAEAAVIAVATIVAMIAFGVGWWWPLVLFLAFDLSFVGYAFGIAAGAALYNTVHNYAVPAVVLVLTVVSGHTESGSWSVIVAGSWIFHVATDRALGFGVRPMLAHLKPGVTSQGTA